MVSFPISVVYNDSNVPGWIAVIKEVADNPFELRITLEGWNRLRFDEVNIEGLLVDLSRAVQDAGLTVADVQALLTFLRFTARDVTLILNGTGTDTIEIILPPGVTVSDVRKATGEAIPFFVNRARNSVVMNVTFASEVELRLILASVQNVLNQFVLISTNVAIVVAVLAEVWRQLGSAIREVRA